jgi:DNA helicase II / ATP-dependent DNA helicase PcrA
LRARILERRKWWHSAWLLKTGAGAGLAPLNIVAFTFTEKAAAELKDRIVMRVAEVVGEWTGRDVRVCTIHGFCLELLKTEVPEFLKFGVLGDIQR